MRPWPGSNPRLHDEGDPHDERDPPSATQPSQGEARARSGSGSSAWSWCVPPGYAPFQRRFAVSALAPFVVVTGTVIRLAPRSTVTLAAVGSSK